MNFNTIILLIGFSHSRVDTAGADNINDGYKPVYSELGIIDPAVGCVMMSLPVSE